MSEMVYTVRVHDERTDGVWAEVTELPGCFASAPSEAELDEPLIEAIGMYLSTPERRVHVSAVEVGRHDSTRKLLVTA